MLSVLTMALSRGTVRLGANIWLNGVLRAAHRRLAGQIQPDELIARSATRKPTMPMVMPVPEYLMLQAFIRFQGAATPGTKFKIQLRNYLTGVTAAQTGFRAADMNGQVWLRGKQSGQFPAGKRHPFPQFEQKRVELQLHGPKETNSNSKSSSCDTIVKVIVGGQINALMAFDVVVIFAAYLEYTAEDGPISGTNLPVLLTAKPELVISTALLNKLKQDPPITTLEQLRAAGTTIANRKGITDAAALTVLRHFGAAVPHWSDRTVPLPSSLPAALATWQTREGKAYRGMSTASVKIVRKQILENGVQLSKIFRHAAATTLLDRGMTTARIRQYLRMQNGPFTDNYTRARSMPWAPLRADACVPTAEPSRWLTAGLPVSLEVIPAVARTLRAMLGTGPGLTLQERTIIIEALRARSKWPCTAPSTGWPLDDFALLTLCGLSDDVAKSNFVALCPFVFSSANHAVAQRILSLYPWDPQLSSR